MPRPSLHKLSGSNFNLYKFQYEIAQLYNYFLKQNEFPPAPAPVKTQNINEGRRVSFEFLTFELIKVLYFKIHIRDLYRGINDLKKGYQIKKYIVQDEKGDLVRDSHSNLATQRNTFFRLFNVNAVKVIRQIEILSKDPLVSELSALEVEMAI